jgi:hypothetical protein
VPGMLALDLFPRRRLVCRQLPRGCMRSAAAGSLRGASGARASTDQDLARLRRARRRAD